MQQLATLVHAVIVYDLLGRLGVARLWATLVAAILVLDAWTIALSQRVLSETFFTLALVLVAWLAVQRRGASLILASGALLGRAACAIAAPFLLYASAHAAVVGTFGLTDANGWFLYGRVAEFADCRRSHVPADSRFLCQASDDPTRKLGAAFYLWNPASPARGIPDGTVTEGPG